MSIQKTRLKTHELFQGNKNVGKWVGGEGPDILDDDVENENRMLIKRINMARVNQNDGANMRYLHLLSIIKGKPIEALSMRDKLLARQAYLSLLNDKRLGRRTITPDMLFRMIRQLKLDLRRQVGGSKRKRKSKSIKKHKSKKHKSKKHKSKKHKSKSIKKRKRVGGR